MSFTKDDIIFEYGINQAISDGIIHRLGNSNHAITDNLFCELQKEYNNSLNENMNFVLCELLPLISYAFKTYEKGGILKTNFKFKVGNYKHSKIIWFIPNEIGGLTLMKPEDY